MIEQHATVDIKVDRQCFENAAKEGQIEILEWLLKKKEGNKRIKGKPNLRFSGDDRLERLFLIACIEGQLEMAKKLLELGAYLHSDSYYIFTVICDSKNEKKEMVKFFLGRGAHLIWNNNHNNKSKCLVRAARNGHEETVKLLLDHGILVNDYFVIITFFFY